MATSLDLFPARVAFVDIGTGRLTQEGYRALQTLFLRVGGAIGPSMADLSIADDDDSGIEELKSETAKALDALALAPVAADMQFGDALTPAAVEFTPPDAPENEVSSLREQIAEMLRTINDLQQGTIS